MDKPTEQDVFETAKRVLPGGTFGNFPGEVIIRDFARLLAGRTKIGANPRFDQGTYPKMILGGISLSGFFINTFIAEGFNADPLDGKPVFDGAIVISMQFQIGTVPQEPKHGLEKKCHRVIA